MKRFKVEQADWHVTLRGARRLLLFHDQEDYHTFYAMLGYSCEQTGVSHIANCLMSNHFHLSLGGGSTPLSRCMWKLDRQYSGYHNKKYGLAGHAFEQEYFREPIPSEFILKRVVRYIHLNPVRAGLSKRPEEYPWSSYLRLLKSSGESLAESERRFLSTFGTDLAVSRAEYKAFVDKDLERPIRRRTTRNSAWEIWDEHFQWFLEFAQESRETIFPLKPEDVAAWWAVRSGVPPRVIASALGLPNGRPVSQLCYRLTKQLERNENLKARILGLGAL